MNACRTFPKQQFGLSYVEVMIATVLIAISIVPIGNALSGALTAAQIDTLESENHYRLVEKMETVLAEPYADLLAAAAGTVTASSYSDAPGVDRRLVYISAYDADNADADDDPFTGTDADILWIQVAIEGSVHSFEALKTN